jgi:hypothetical protein
VLEEAFKVFTVWLYLFVFHVQDYGVSGIIFLILFEHWLPWTVKSIGLMIYAKPFDEATALRVAWAYEQATDWHRRRPDLAWAR